jgi:hypothetical protein
MALPLEGNSELSFGLRSSYDCTDRQSNKLRPDTAVSDFSIVGVESGPQVRIDYFASQEASCLPGGRLQPIELPARQSKGPPCSDIARGDPEAPAPSTGRGWAGRFALGHHLG